jgi:subtilisin family serine protease
MINKIVITKLRFVKAVIALSFVMSLCTVYGQTQWLRLPNDSIIQVNKNHPISYTYTKEHGKLKSLQVEDPQEVVKVIVTLKDEPLALYKKKYAFQKTSLATVQSTLQAAHSSVKNKISAIAQQLSAKTNFHYQYTVRREYYTAINGMALECNRGMMTYIRSLPEVKNVQLDELVKADLTQSVHQIRADIVQDSLGYKGDSVLVGEIDTGIDYKNPALGGGFGPGYRVIGGHDFVNNDNDPMDDNGHGTHVAGIIGADGGKDLTGVAPKVKFLAVKVIDQNGMGYMSDVVAGIEYCMDPDNNPATNDGVDVINMSLGALPMGNFSLAGDEAVDNATQAGILSVVAAGNDGVPSYYYAFTGPYRTIGSPGTAASALTVGACDSTYSIADFSSRGPDRTNFAIKPEVAAPGVSILSTVLNNRTASWSGTSMATPHVTGVAALLKQQHRDWPPEQLKSAIINSAKSLDNAYLPYEEGNGCVDALSAATLGVSVQPGVINFGIADISEDVWKDTVEFTVKNLRDISQNINLAIQSGLPAGAELNLSQTSFNLASLQEIQITATLAMPKSVPIVYEYPYGYTGNIICRSDSDRVRVPFAVIKSNILTIESDLTVWNLWLYDQSNFIDVTSEAPGVDNKYSLPVDNSTYNLLAGLLTTTSKNFFYYISRKINTAESNHIMLNHNEAVYSAFNDLDLVRDIHDNPVDNINNSPLEFIIVVPNYFTSYENFTPQNGQWFFGPMDSSVTVIQSLLSVRGNEALLLKKMSSGIKAQSDLSFLSGPQNLGELNFKLNYTNSSATRPFIEMDGAINSDKFSDAVGLNSGYILPDYQEIHFVTNRDSIFNPINYSAMSAGFGTFGGLNQIPPPAPISELCTPDFIVDGKGNFVFFERKPFRPDPSDYVNIQTLQSGDTMTVEKDAYYKNVQVPKFQLLYQYACGTDLSLSQFNLNSYDDGGVMCPDGVHSQVDDNSSGSQFTPQMFAKNTLLPVVGVDDEFKSVVYDDYKLNDNTDRYNLTAETFQYFLSGQRGLARIDYEFNVKPTVSQYYFLPTLDLFQILADGKITQWLRPGQDGKVRLVIFDPKQNVDSVGISLLKNDATELNLATTHPSAKEYLASIPQDIPGGFLDVIAKVHNTEGNTFTLTVSPAFYFGANMDSVQYDSRVRLKTYSLDNINSVQFNRGDTLEYTLTFVNYGNFNARDVSIHFPQTEYFTPVGDSTITLDSIWTSRQKNYGEIPLTLVFLGKKLASDNRSYYTPSISWNSNGRPFSRKYPILVDFSSTPTNVTEFGNAVPKDYSLSQNYPNPFNPATQIKYFIPRTGYVSLKVYDLLGQEVATLHAGVQQAGSYVVTFDGTRLASGVYFYRLQADNFVETKKLVLLK